MKKWVILNDKKINNVWRNIAYLLRRGQVEML
jgi:hypothetical protein